MIEVLLASTALDPGSLRSVIYGGAPSHRGTIEQVLERHPHLQLTAIYGTTEGGPIAVLGPDDHRAGVNGVGLGASGRPAPGVELRIEDPDGDGVGAVAVSAAHLFVTDDDGWLRPGDLGRLDGDGRLHLVGRAHDRIVRGGENVLPSEVEDVVAQHPQVREVAVVGVPDRWLGEQVAAFVVPTSSTSPPDTDELRSFARAQLAGYKVPQRWTFVTELPRNPTGKVLRRRLRPDPTEEVTR